ncbi:hypothetical protein [Streptomyces sp. NRRL S-118]|uniref:hypothetical protein n=1 Tax=Streptomyces sp. NRRL S-118 TaxID=1463881 RepID=UPI0007C7F91D|nr:hypothetical protein [Streptomyces sp. NRRL S-118]
MAGTAFPDDLRAAQTRLHQAASELAALLRTPPWSVESLPGRPGTQHPHTGEVTGGRERSPGWTRDQQDAVRRLRRECTDLSARITTHPFWSTVEAEQRVPTRTELKQVTKAAVAAALGITEAA